MTEHLEDLDTAFTYYKETAANIDFENGNMFSFVYLVDRKTKGYVL